MSKKWSLVATICGQYLARPLIYYFWYVAGRYLSSTLLAVIWLCYIFYYYIPLRNSFIILIILIIFIILIFLIILIILIIFPDDSEDIDHNNNIDIFDNLDNLENLYYLENLNSWILSMIYLDWFYRSSWWNWWSWRQTYYYLEFRRI